MASSTSIRFATERSGLLTMIRDSIRDRKDSIRSGEQVEVVLKSAHDGYRGEHIVEISDGQDKHFKVEAAFRDPSRFPARISAAASALRKLDLTGRFRIKHEKNSLWIQSLSPTQLTLEEEGAELEEKLLDAAYEDPSVTEGKRKLVAHFRIERNRSIIQKKREQVMKTTGKLVCECCGFDFSKYYGSLGHGFCEVHHRVPLADLHGETDTKLSDLAIVCANCHRVLHRGSGAATVEELTGYLVKRTESGNATPEHQT